MSIFGVKGLIQRLEAVVSTFFDGIGMILSDFKVFLLNQSLGEMKN